MAYWFYKLLPPRPTFPGDITPDEGLAMVQHAAYWQELVQQGHALVFGPVIDPEGLYGVAVLRGEDDAAAQARAQSDPAIVAQLGFSFRLYPMPNAISVHDLPSD